MSGLLVWFVNHIDKLNEKIIGMRISNLLSKLCSVIRKPSVIEYESQKVIFSL